MRSKQWLTLGLCLLGLHGMAQGAASVFIEDLTWMEVREAIASGKTTALYYAGSTEQNGPHMATGKHNWIARYVAGKIADRLGNALVYPVMPFAPTGSPVRKTAHMAYPGSVSVEDDTYARVAHDVTLSAIAAGFQCVVLMGDHGGGQDALGAVAREINNSEFNRGARVVHALEVYEESNVLAMALLKKMQLPYGDHASIIDTSELMFVSPADVRMSLRGKANALNGSSGFAQLATAQLGEKFVGFKVQVAVEKIKDASGCGH